jgi:hypothetical protein
MRIEFSVILVTILVCVFMYRSCQLDEGPLGRNMLVLNKLVVVFSWSAVMLLI